MGNSNQHHLRGVELKHGIPMGTLGGSKGWFHRWTEQPISEENGVTLTKTVAVIELLDGSLILVDPQHFKFVVSDALLKA